VKKEEGRRKGGGTEQVRKLDLSTISSEW